MTTTEHDRGHEKFVNEPPHFVMKFKFNAMKLMILIENEFKLQDTRTRTRTRTFSRANDFVKTSFDKPGGGGAP